jgi:RNA polymerase sigma factor (sigma-70 family)
MALLPSAVPQWPLEIARLQATLRSTSCDMARDTLRGALWRLLFEALSRHLRFHGRSAPAAEPADLEDIAASKALEMLSRAESGAWDLSGRSAAEISGYVASAARHGWVDHVQRSARHVRLANDEALDPRVERGRHPARPEDSPANRTEAREIASALRACVERLPERERRVWLFRAYYEMSSRTIAQHPLISLNAAHVDVVAQRARAAVRECMTRKGHDVGDLPPGTFVDLWEVLESMARPSEMNATRAARISG